MSAPVAVNTAVNVHSRATFNYSEYHVSAGYSHGPPTAVNALFGARQTYYVLAGSTPVLVHNCGEQTFYHGTDLDSAVELANGAPLDAETAAARYTDGPGGFFTATHYEDAEYFGLRKAPGAVLDVTFSRTAMDALHEAGAVVRDIPRSPKSPNFVGQEFHIPTSAFDVLNNLRSAGEIVFRPH
jgi:hypothetical protein